MIKMVYNGTNSRSGFLFKGLYVDTLRICGLKVFLTRSIEFVCVLPFL
uniref:Uncharacterized protein n=1 Tax=Anguilla anguilla TaxID=7936 RepID=A0A0E9PG16_ANGAN